MIKTHILNILPFFLNITADQWVDWNLESHTGENLFNNTALQKGVPFCDVFSCGAQASNEGTVSLHIQNPVNRYYGYGVNKSKKVSTSFEITLNLPSGAYSADRLKQLLSYEEILLLCIEQMFSKPSEYVSGWSQSSIDFDTYTIGGKDFDPSQEATKIEKTKIVATVSAEAFIQGV